MARHVHFHAGLLNFESTRDGLSPSFFLRYNTNMAKILVIDDEPSIVNLIMAYLKPEGYEVFTAADGNAGLKAAHAFQPDLIVLDLMLPGKDGFEVLSQLRRESNVYVILLTAKTEETDRIVGLSVGADDYVTKPFSPRELVARIKAALRRLRPGMGSGSENKILAFRHMRMDLGARRVSLDGHPVELTAVEFDLLRSPGRKPREGAHPGAAARGGLGCHLLWRNPRRGRAPGAHPPQAWLRKDCDHGARRGLPLRG